jgi:hypothetical protein
VPQFVKEMRLLLPFKIMPHSDTAEVSLLCGTIVSLLCGTINVGPAPLSTTLTLTIVSPTNSWWMTG